ncbi:hypothetical protein EJB05_05207, partial [Eragrostis curvula]
MTLSAGASSVGDELMGDWALVTGTRWRRPCVLRPRCSNSIRMDSHWRASRQGSIWRRPVEVVGCLAVAWRWRQRPPAKTNNLSCASEKKAIDGSTDARRRLWPPWASRVAAAGSRAPVQGPRQARRGGEPAGRTSRVFGVGGDRASEQELRELVNAMQARRGTASSAGAVVRSEKPPDARRGAVSTGQRNGGVAQRQSGESHTDGRVRSLNANSYPDRGTSNGNGMHKGTHRDCARSGQLHDCTKF